MKKFAMIEYATDPQGKFDFEYAYEVIFQQPPADNLPVNAMALNAIRHGGLKNIIDKSVYFDGKQITSTPVMDMLEPLLESEQAGTVLLYLATLGMKDIMQKFHQMTIAYQTMEVMRHPADQEIIKKRVIDFFVKGDTL